MAGIPTEASIYGMVEKAMLEDFRTYTAAVPVVEVYGCPSV